MKELLAVLILLSVGGTSLVLAARKRITAGLTAMFLAFSVLTSWLILNHEGLGKVRDIFSASANKERAIVGSKSDAPKKTPKDGEPREAPPAQSVEVKSENDIRVLLDSQKESVENLSKSLKKREEELRENESRLRDVKEKLDELKAQLATARRESSELALLMTRIIWLQVETRDETDPERSEKANQQILDQLDEIVKLAISDPVARSRFVDDVKNALPAKQ